MALGRLAAAWSEVVGEHLAARTAPIRLTGGVLTVRAQAGAWASELTLLAPRLAERVDAWLGGGLVTAISVASSGSSRRP